MFGGNWTSRWKYISWARMFFTSLNGKWPIFEKNNLGWVIFFELLVQLSQNFLKMLNTLLCMTWMSKIQISPNPWTGVGHVWPILTNFSKIGHFPFKGVKNILAQLIYFHLLVQLPPNTLQMLISLLFYDVKLKNPSSPFLQPIFDHFWPFLAIFGPPDFDTIVDTLLLITRLP